jgi:phosphatidate phosphatase PAH1
MKAVLAAGIEFEAVYGNTTTDIHAYEKLRIPKEKTYIVGFFGGKEKTVDIGGDFTSHFEHLNNVPVPEVPFFTTPEW